MSEEESSAGAWANLTPDPAETAEVQHVTPEDVGLDQMDTPPPSAEEVENIEREEAAREFDERQKHTCPKCSWDIRDKLLKAQEEDLQEYTRCIVAGRNFRKDIKMFDGSLVCTFTENSDAVREAITDLVKTIPLKGSTELEFVTATRKIQVLYSLNKLLSGELKKEYKLPQESDMTFKDAEEAVAEFDKRFGGRSASVQGIIFRAYLNFDRLLQVLADGAFDVNFYRGAGLV